MNENERRIWNRELALNYVKAGIPIFPTDPENKTPLVKRFTQLDSDIPKAEKDQINAEKHADDIANGREPTDHDFIGCTLHPETIRKMWRKHPNATPSISTGPAGLIVIDADIKEGINGPDELRAFFEPHGGIPKTASVVHTQSGGMHVYFRNTAKLGCKKGAFADLRCDVRGIGGQTVAPVAIREDGKTYTPDNLYAKLIPAFTSDQLCDIPDYVVEMIGKAPIRNEDSTVTTENEAKLQSELEDAPDETFEELFTDPIIALYDIDKLSEKDSEFNELYTNPTEDTSNNRFKIARRLLAEWPQMPVNHYATFLDNWEGSGTHVEDQPKKGEYNDRSIKREFLKGQNDFKVSDGTAFGIVEEDDGDKPHDYGTSIKVTKSAKALIGTRTLDEMLSGDTPNVEWIVKGVVARHTTSTTSGMWGAGKTAGELDMCLHIAYGLDWRGRKTTQGAVYYVALENALDVERRVNSWHKRNAHLGLAIRKAVFVLITRDVCLYDHNAKQTDHELQLIRTIKHFTALYGMHASRVVIDTVSQSIAPGDDQSSADASIFTKAMQRISLATGANVTGICHPTKQGKGTRGSGVWEANVDTTLFYSWSKEKRSGVMNAGTKFRIGNPAKIDFKYKLEAVEMGVDEDGDPIEVVLAVDPNPFGVAADDSEPAAPHDEPGNTVDELTPEQNDAIEVKRVASVNAIAAWVKTQREQRAWLVDARVDLPVLAKLYRDSPSNFVREIHVQLMDAGPKAQGADVRVDGGRLHFIKAGGRFAFKFVPSG